MGGFLKKSAGVFKHVGVCASHHVGVVAECDACVAQVVLFGAVAGDAHNDAAWHSCGFLQGAECAAGGVAGYVFFYAGCGGQGAEVLHGGGGGEHGGHLEKAF